MNSGNSLYRFDFYNNAIIDNQIRKESIPNLNLLISHSDPVLAGNVTSAVP